MADELKMVHGEPNWDAKHNALVDTVEKMGGVVNGLQWSSRTDLGIVLPAGLEYYDQHWYTYAQVGQRKLVHLHLSLKVTGEVKGNIVLPDVIKPWAPAQGLACDHAFWSYWGSIGFYQLANQRPLAVGDGLLVDKVYVI